LSLFYRVNEKSRLRRTRDKEKSRTSMVGGGFTPQMSVAMVADLDPSVELLCYKIKSYNGF
jgi:hypothetical protein